jgi:hypothetical protein
LHSTSPPYKLLSTAVGKTEGHRKYNSREGDCAKNAADNSLGRKTAAILERSFQELYEHKSVVKAGVDRQKGTAR